MPETANYEWLVSDILGHGSYGYVYAGRSKATTGETKEVAVKCFTGSVKEVEMVKLLKETSCKNVVKVITIEKEIVNGMPTDHDVLIMEYCNGKSLGKILEEDDNIFGLAENDLISVIVDLTNAVKHLRQHSLIHRDINPSNIMKHTTDEQVIYKLCDFSFLRKLNSSDQFSTHAGTWTYMDPRSIGRNYMNMRQYTTGAKTDLWSIGVTFFELATGKVAFQNFPNQRSYFDYSINKSEGVISAVRNKVGDNITFIERRDLPETCRLSPSVKFNLEELLASLLEAREENRQWTYQKYYDFVNENFGPLKQ